VTRRWFIAAALLVGLAAAAADAAETPTRIFHIGIVVGTPRSNPEHVALRAGLCRRPQPDD
jgi:hypothetical protein